MKIILCVVCLQVAGMALYAQSAKTTENVQQVWLGYFNQTRLSDKWGVWLEAHSNVSPLAIPNARDLRRTLRDGA